MSSTPTLKELKDLKAKLQESVKGYKGAKLTPVGGKDFSATKTGKQEPTPVKRDEGVAAAEKEGHVEHGKKGEPEGNKVTPNKNKEGVKDAVKEFEAKQVEQGAEVKAVDRAEGVSAAEKKWISPAEFKSSLRKSLGLPLNSPLNKGNDGLNKAPKGGSVDGNKNPTDADAEAK